MNLFYKLGTLTGILFAIVTVLGIVFGPFIVVWAWNALFGSAVEIPYTFQTWLAVIILGSFLKAPLRARLVK